MKTFLSLLTGVAACALGASAYGDADLSFSGGSGTPLSLTLNAPVTYTITANATDAPVFVFDDVGNIYANANPPVTGTITYEITNLSGVTSGPFTLDTANSGLTAGNIFANAAYLLGEAKTATSGRPGVVAGDIVTLEPGTDTTTGPITAAAPGAGSFSTFISNTSATSVSEPGMTVVPEPSTWALLGMGAGLLSLTLRRRTARV